MKKVTKNQDLMPYKILRDYVKNTANISSSDLDYEIAQAIGYSEKSVQNINAGKRAMKWREAKDTAKCLISLCKDTANLQVLRVFVQEFLATCGLADTESEVTENTVEDFVHELFGKEERPPEDGQVARHRFSNLPDRQISGNIIRTELQNRIHNAIHESKIIFLSGITGTGKSFIAKTIAQEYYTKHPDRYPNAIWYLCKKDANNLNELITTILMACGVPNTGNMSRAQKEEYAEQYLKKQNAIIVVDSFECLSDSGDMEAIIQFITEKIPSDCIVMLTSNERLSKYRKCLKTSTRFWEAKVENLTFDEWCKLSEICAESQEDIREAKEVFPNLDHYIYNLCKGNPFIMTHMLSTVSEKLLTGVSFENLREEYDYLNIGKDFYNTLLKKTIDDLSDNCVRLLVALSLFATPVCAKDLGAITGMDNINADGSVKMDSDLQVSILRCHNLYLIERHVSNGSIRFFLPVMLYQLLEREIKTNTSKYQDILDRWVSHYINFTAKIGFCFDNFAKLAQLDGDNQVREIDNIIRVLRYCQFAERWEDYYKISENTKYFFYTRGISGEGQKSVHYIRAYAARKLGNYADEFDSLMYHCNVMCKSQSWGGIDKCFSRLEELIQITPGISERNMLKFQYLKGLHKYSIGQYETARQFFEEYESKAKCIFESTSELKQDKMLTHDYIACLRWHSECIFSTIVKHGNLAVSVQIVDEINALLDEAIHLSEPIGFERAIVHSLLIKIKTSYELLNDTAAVHELLARLKDYESVIESDAVYRKVCNKYKQLVGGI